MHALEKCYKKKEKKQPKTKSFVKIEPNKMVLLRKVCLNLSASTKYSVIEFLLLLYTIYKLVLSFLFVL